MFFMLRKYYKYARDGSLWGRIKLKLCGAPAHIKVRWYGAESVDEAIKALTGWGRFYANQSPSGWLLCLGSDATIQAQIVQKLQADNIDCHLCHPESIDEVLSGRTPPLAVLCANLETARITEQAALVASHPRLTGVPFEYAEGVDPTRRQFAQWDEYANTFFVSPSLQDSPNPYQIYAKSLECFEQKCGIRDYLDFYQMLRSIGDRSITGAVAEFGSYKGHSGWLMAESLKAMGQDRDIYLFDMFEHFPEEYLGIDRFWSKTHHVDFDQVRQKLAEHSNVQLVKGDFTQTLVESDVGPLAFAYVDCDSYRATRYLFDKILNDYLVLGGVLICEDYGHPALLGSRLAVHEILDRRSDLVRFYSQFSGLYIAVKVA